MHENKGHAPENAKASPMRALIIPVNRVHYIIEKPTYPTSLISSAKPASSATLIPISVCVCMLGSRA